MADDEHDAHPDAAIPGDSPAVDDPAPTAGEPAVTPDDALAVAEEAAAREAAAEAAHGDGPKVVRPRARTSRKSNEAEDAAPATTAGADITVIPPASPASAGRTLDTDSLTIRQGGLEEVTARSIDISQGGIGRATADDIAISTGGIGFARGDRVSVEMGAIGAAIAGDVRITQGAAGTILARDVRIEQAGIRTIIANHVHVERTTGVLFLIARRVDGDVRALLDWRGALAFGAAFGVVASLFRRRRR